MSSSDSNNTASPSPADEAGKYIGGIFLIIFWILCGASPIFIARLYRKWFSIRSPSPWDFLIPGCLTLFGGFIYFNVSLVILIECIERHKLSFSRTATIFACIAFFYVVTQFFIMVAIGACLELKKRRERRDTRESEGEDGIRMEARKRDNGVARVS